jgi:hypothetical protein
MREANPVKSTTNPSANAASAEQRSGQHNQDAGGAKNSHRSANTNNS